MIPELGEAGLFIFLNCSLKYNLHAIKYACLKCIIQWSLVYLWICTRNPLPPICCQLPIPLPPSALSNHYFTSHIYRFICWIFHLEAYKKWSFVIGFTLAQCFRVRPCWSRTSFLFCPILFHCVTITHLIYPFFNWSTFRLLWIMPLGTYITSLCGCKFHFSLAFTSAWNC